VQALNPIMQTTMQSKVNAMARKHQEHKEYTKKIFSARAILVVMSQVGTGISQFEKLPSKPYISINACVETELAPMWPIEGTKRQKMETPKNSWQETGAREDKSQGDTPQISDFCGIHPNRWAG